MDKPYLLIRGELCQQTAASFGGNGESSWVDQVLCRDGLGRCTLRGESLAGALKATARKLFQHLPATLGDMRTPQPSVWRTFTSHPRNAGSAEVRQGVRIHAQTGAAKDGALFDAETLPPGTRWPFVLEIDLQRAGDEVDQVCRVTLHTLHAWTQGRCWLGRSVARGTGWFRLENVRIVALDREEWPDSRIADVAAHFDTHFHSRAQPLPSWLTGFDPPDGDWTWREYRVRLTVAPGQDDYGMDFLSVGGHAGDALLLDLRHDLEQANHLLLPQASLKSEVIETWVADQVFAYTRRDGKVHPYIPGSSLRGPLRHAAAWWARKQGADAGCLNALFGTMDSEPQAGALLVSDAHVLDDDWQAVLLKMHAEDEFAGGVYGSSLFDRLVLSQARFAATLVVETRKTEIEKLDGLLQPALALARQGFVGLGGQVWRGLGRLRWEIDRETT